MCRCKNNQCNGSVAARPVATQVARSLVSDWRVIGHNPARDSSKRTTRPTYVGRGASVLLMSVYFRSCRKEIGGGKTQDCRTRRPLEKTGALGDSSNAISAEGGALRPLMGRSSGVHIFATTTSSSPDFSFTTAAPHSVGFPAASNLQPKVPALAKPHCPAFTATTYHPEPAGFPALFPLA